MIAWAKEYISDHPYGKLVDIDSILANCTGAEIDAEIMRGIRRADDALEKEMMDTFLQNTKNMERYDPSGFEKEWIDEA